MPSTITHAYIGLDTLEKLNKEPKDIISKHVNNYKVYCQNMDVLYFYHIFLLFSNKIQNLGHAVHHEYTYDLFKILIDDNQENKDPELFTFIAGLITHYKADSIIHPYVNYFGETSNEEKFKTHFDIEAYLDSYFARERMKIDHKRDNNSKTIFNYTKEDIVEKEISKVYKELYNYPNMGKKYYRSLKEMRFVFNYFRYDKHGIKMFLYKLLDLNPIKSIQRVKYLSYHFDLEKEDYYLNTNHNEWFNIKDESIKSNKSFFDLYEDVTNEASNIINNIYEYVFNNKDIDLENVIGNNSYAHGLPLIRKKKYYYK